MQSSLPMRLRVLRAERGLSLTEAAERAGIQRQTLARLERGDRHPHDVTLAKLAHAYGVPVEDLLEEPAPLSEASATGQPETGPSGRSRSRSGSSAEPHLTIPEEALSELEADELRYIEDLLKEGRVWIPLAELVRESVRRR